MARQFDRSNYRDEGRRQWRDDDNGRGGQFGRGQERPRDEQGRFMSEDDDRGYFGQRGNERDPQERGYRGGDDYSRGGRDRYDDYGRSAGGNYRDNYGDNYGEENYREDNYSRGNAGRDFGPRDEYGRFSTEDERGPQRGANQYGRWQDDYDREPYGPYQGRAYEGDPGRERYDDDSYRRERGYEGSRGMQGPNQDRDDWQRGGQDRNQRYDERDDRGRFQSRDESDQRGSQGRGSQGRGRQDDQRGWFGDPRGHAAAARLGWRHRQH